jgi:FkbM family methyltransferase
VNQKVSRPRSVQGLLQEALLAAYGVAARTGIMRHPLAQRVFLAAYSVYKARIEAGPIDRLQEFIPAGSTVIDVGANVGFFTRRFARWVGDQGRVIAIEPDTENFAALSAKLAASGLDRRVQLHRAAATAEAGFVHLERNELHPGDHRISFGAHGSMVPAVAIDDLVREAEVASIALIKIDVQGAEMLVLEGTRRTLAEMQPVLFLEVDDSALRSFGSSASEVVTYVEEAGYEMHELTKDGPPRKLSRDRLLAEATAHSYTDVLFLPTPMPLGQSHSTL